jgi:hypothetical protein
MRTLQVFPIGGTALLEQLRSVGLSGISCNRKDYGTHVSVSTVWLCLNDGTVLRFQPEMHDLEGWDEVGTLEIERVELSGVVSPFVKLGGQWQHVATIEKLVISEPGYFSAESGLKITNHEQEIIIICNNAAPYELALSAPTIHDPFNPEYPLERYVVCPVFLE